MIWKVKSKILTFERPLLMGILNLTPDSFSDGGQFMSQDKALRHAEQMIREGADLLDLGAESTRPGAASVSSEEETDRLLPVLRAVREMSDIPISVDTTKPEVACEALKAGADIVNDVSALKDSGYGMAELVRDFGAGLVLMHRRGTPETMQSLTDYQDVVSEVLDELEGSIDFALQSGILLEQIVVDPGLGFAKTTEQNLEIIGEIDRFFKWGRPVLLGPSRKSFIGKVTRRKPDGRQFGTAAVVAVSVMKGVSILRIHDVGAMRDVIQMTQAIEGASHVRTF